MNEKRYSVLPFTLALIAFVISTFPYIHFTLRRTGLISKEFSTFLRQLMGGPVSLISWGWIPGLVIAIIAFKMTRHMKEGLLRNITRIISSLTTIPALVWGICIILVLYALS